MINKENIEEVLTQYFYPCRDREIRTDSGIENIDFIIEEIMAINRTTVSVSKKNKHSYELCGNCEGFVTHYNYCPNCGAKLNRRKESF